MLTKFYFLSTSSFFYIEFDSLIIYNFLGIIKIKNKQLTSFLIKKKTLSSWWLNDAIVHFIKYIFLLILFGYNNKFKLIVIGYRQFYSNNMIVFKLRYSHLVYKILPFDILTLKKTKKRKYFVLYSLNKDNLNRIMHLWLSYRRLNIYTKKGFFKKKHKYLFKPIIKRVI